MNSKKINSPKKNSVGRATLTKQMSTDFSNMPSNEEVERQFVQVLDSLLTPPHVKEQLIKSQSKEKKWTTVLLHQEGSNITTTGKWGDRDNSLLAQIQKAKTPDVQMILRLKTSLSSANKDYMKAFLEAGGVSLLLKAVDSSINRKPMTQMDIAILYEILSCFKAVMNNSTGMDGFLAIDGSVDILTRCLKFEYKMFVLLVLEMLSVCCYYSPDAANLVVCAMRTLAKLNREAPFAILTHSLVVQDVELKAAIMVFVNSMIMGIDDINAHALLRSDLNSQLFEESYDKAAAQVTREEKLLRRMSEASDVESKSIRRKTLVSMHGSKAYSQQQIEQLLKTGEAQDVDPAFLLVKSKGQTVRVNPRQGSMAGLLIAAKNAEKLESAFVDLLGGKKTKRRWYELDDNYFKWCAGHDRENEFKEFIPINSIIDVRPYSTDVYIKELGAPAFEMETTERVYAFGCESAADKDHWITALQVSRENHYLRNGEYKIVAKELQPADVFKFAEQFRKQGEVYHQISVEHKRMALTACGLDLTDICKVFDYLRLETIAIGVNSHLLKILQELLLIPAGSETLWAALSSAIQQLREQSGRSSEVVHKTLNKKSIVELFDNKGEGGQTYTQMSKLAMLAVNSETQIKELTQRLHNSEKEAERMREKIVQLKNANANFTRENGDVVEKSELVAKHIPKFQNNDATASPALPTIPPPPLPQAPPPSAVVAPSSANPLMQNIRFAKYEKMKKMLPEGAVRQKMQVDGLTEDEIENFMSGTIAAAPAPEAPANIPDSRFEKYEKMKKMLPEGAVRQKMQTDGFSENEIEAFMNGVTVAPLATVTAASVDPRLEKYVKMKKMLPEGAVRQKMQVDGFSESEIESFMTGTTPTAPATAAPAVDPRFEKYEKMKKMLPEGAVRQKMQTDGFSADEIESFMSGKPMIAVAAASSGPSADDLRFAKYEKMKKMLAEGAVRQKMVADGFTESDINKFFNASGAVAAFSKPVAKAPAVELPPEGMQAKKAVKPLGKMKGFFWVKLKSSEVPGTIWHKMNEFEIPENDKKELIEWFGTVTKVEQPASRSNSPVKDRKPQLISLLDGKRTQNWLIFMGKVRMGPEDLIKLVIDLNPDRLTHELTTNLLAILPTPEELAAVKEYTNPKGLDNASQLLFQFNRISRLNQRMEAHEIAFTWSNAAGLVASQLGVIQCACDELKKSEVSFRDLLSIVLGLGNYINGDTARGQAYGLKPDVLSKLQLMKANNASNGTLLNFLALEVVRYKPKLKDFTSDWVATWAAADVPFKQLVTDVTALEKQLTVCKNEFDRIKEGNENIGLDNQLENVKGRLTEPLHRRLKMFLNFAVPRLQSIKSQTKATETSIESLIRLFGDNAKSGGEEDSSKQFFNNIVTFARAFSKAIDENNEKQIMLEKASAKAAAAENGISSPERDARPSISSKDSNIFSRFQASQAASSNDVVAEFKSKLARKFQKANSSTEY